MRATRALDLELVLAGHGKPVDDPNALIDRRIEFHEERAARILEIVRERPQSAHGIAIQIWGDVATSQAYLTTCEVLGHLDLLEERGQIAADESGAIVVFHAVGVAGSRA